ncbi:MAG: ATP-binding protein [Pseudoxanthomonas sp.]
MSEQLEAHRVLVLAPIGRDAPATADLLRRSGIGADVCRGYDDLMAELGAGADAAFVAEEALFGKDLAPLAEWIECQQPWSDLPFVILTSRHDEPRVTAWRQQLVSKLGNVTLLERPVQPLTLVSVMRAALRARARQMQVRSLMAAREQAATQLESLVVRRTAQLEKANSKLRAEMGERARIQESLRHAQKLEALGQLTGGVAHDFNNLLMVITAGLDMLERQQEPQRRTRTLQGMRHAAQRGASLTRQLLAFSRSHALRPETVDLGTHLDDMKELLGRSLSGNIRVQVDMAADLWPVQVDPGELELVLLNLAVNARDAMQGGGGVITVRGENVANRDSQDFVSVSVSDTGSGMSEEVRERIFEPFFTTKDVGKGSGLGLAQVYGFAQQSGGTVEVASVLGQGSTITLLLPRSHQPLPPAHAPCPMREVSPEHSSGCVLLVEDDSEVAALVNDMLRDLGYEVIHCSSAAAALGALANARHIDLMFSDIMMPGGTSGIELAREARLRRPALPILLTSGFAERSRADALSLNIPVLAKPYGLEDLRHAIAQLPTSSG